MLPPEVSDWYATLVQQFESSYLRWDEPWKQSGHFSSEEMWHDLRRPIADCVTTDGSFLDIGCANGYLLECLLEWVGEREIALDPWGLELSPRLLELAKTRLPSHAAQLALGNALVWSPPQRFDYIRTGLYAPRAYEKRYLSQLRDKFLSDAGRLLVVEYRGGQPDGPLTIDRRVTELGFAVHDVKVAPDSTGQEGVRIAVVQK